MKANKLWTAAKACGALVGLTLVLLLVRNFAELVRYGGLPTMSGICAGIVGRGLLEESSPTALSKGFSDRQHLIALAPEPDGVRDHALWQYCAEHTVPIPLVEGSSPPGAVAFGSESVQMPRSYDPSFVQVLTFASPRSGAWDAQACILVPTGDYTGFRTVGVGWRTIPPAQASRSGRDFFDIAQRLWDAANEGRKDKFDEARGEFDASDSFWCSEPMDGFALSGEQLDLMAGTLADAKQWAE